jgi:hypothetical protein
MVALAHLPLRGVARRRAEDLRIEEAPHDTLLKPLAPGMLVIAKEDDFIAAVLADLAAPDWRERLAARAPQHSQGAVALSQPIHRQHALVLLEAACEQPGGPRLDPRKIKEAGVVLRRFNPQGAGLQGWMNWKDRGAARRGWLALGAETADPDPALRDLRSSGHPELDRMLARQRGGEAAGEQTFPLFTAPPDLCQQLGKTILYAVVPVTSAESAIGDKRTPDYAADAADYDEHFSIYFTAREARSMPRANLPIGDWLKETPKPDADVMSFILFLRQLVMECDAFGASPQAAQLRTALAQIDLGTPTDVFLRDAADILLAGAPNTQGLHMPAQWPAISAELSDRLRRAALNCMSARFAQVAGEAGKFDRQEARYSVRAFVRVACKAGCPAKLVWTRGPSEPFRVLPWWAGQTPPVRVPLPAMSDLRHLNPGVTFQVPKKLSKFLNQDLTKVLEGKPPGEGAGGIDMLCSFSIPIITICAFIVLSLFLALFDLVFRWLMFVKICLPLPKREA